MSWPKHSESCTRKNALKLIGDGAGLKGLKVHCTECKAERDLDGALSPSAHANLRCDGKSPWLKLPAVGCNHQPVAIQRGASNAYFPVIASALDVPPFGGSFKDTLEEYWPDLVALDISQRAEGLQNLHSARRDTLMDIARRFQANNARPLPDSWLFPDLPTPEAVDATAPEHLGRVERRAWVKAARDKLVEQKCEQLAQELIAGASMDASFERGELRFFIDGVPVIERVFVDDAEGAFILAQWKVIASTFTITEKTTGKKLAEALRRVAPAAPEPLRSQVIALVEALTNTERHTATAEAEMNRRLYVLYGLTPAEIALVERG